MSLLWSVAAQCWRTAQTFRISRGARIHVEVLELTLDVNGIQGRGECLPYARYSETLESCTQEINEALSKFNRQPTRNEIRDVMSAGAARNAVDAALWDLEAKQAGKRAWELAGITAMKAVPTAYTLSADTPANMAAHAKTRLDYPLLKLKLIGGEDMERVKQVHQAHPTAHLIVDANEAWDSAMFETVPQQLSEFGVKMIEQPLPAGSDSAVHPVDGIEICADESVHDLASLDSLGDRYSMINIKLDKSGGLTEALLMEAEARKRGLKVMTGCMLATSLAMAPALVVAQRAEYVDLDGPLLLKHDRMNPIVFDGPNMQPPSAKLWG